MATGHARQLIDLGCLALGGEHAAYRALSASTS
jgi:hypothetical protein